MINLTLKGRVFDGVSTHKKAVVTLDSEKVGLIREGNLADIVIVKGNPLENIEKLAPENILHVVKGGEVYSSS
jgi:imidazolonepropionase-like amidohydrolase